MIKCSTEGKKKKFPSGQYSSQFTIRLIILSNIIEDDTVWPNMISTFRTGYHTSWCTKCMFGVFINTHLLLSTLFNARTAQVAILCGMQLKHAFSNIYVRPPLISQHFLKCTGKNDFQAKTTFIREYS